MYVVYDVDAYINIQFLSHTTTMHNFVHAFAMPGIVECDENCILPYRYVDYEYEKSDQVILPPLGVQGRLRSHSQFWLDELEPSPFVREVIEHEYRIPFIRLPDPVCYRNT